MSVMQAAKAVHDVQAKKEVRRFYWLLFYALVGFNGTMMYFTWELYSWDVVSLIAFTPLLLCCGCPISNKNQYTHIDIASPLPPSQMEPASYFVGLSSIAGSYL